MTPFWTLGAPNAPPPVLAKGLLAPKAPPPAEEPVMDGMSDWRKGLLPVVCGCSGAVNVGSVVAERCGANGDGAPVNDLLGGEETLFDRGGRAPKLVLCERPCPPCPNEFGWPNGEFPPGELAPLAPLAPGWVRPGDAAGELVNWPPCWNGKPVDCG